MGELVPGIAHIEPVKKRVFSAVLTFWRFAGEVSRFGTVGHTDDSREVGAATVSATDKAKNKAQELGGKAKEAAGKVTGDRSAEARGKDDQTKSHLKGAGEKIKDAFKKK
jgi:uncharacterized protein YjbJ (UPF0337 family)